MKLRRPPRKARRRQRRRSQVQRIDAVGAIALPQMNVSDTARRRRRRQQGQRLRRTTQLVRNFVWSARWVSLGLLLLAVYALLLVASDERYFLTRVPVDGVVTIPPSEIVDASGLGGQHIFAANPGAAAAAIAQVPGIISATVTLAWPNQVTIMVVEDSPIAVWQQGEETFWLNRQGAIFPARGAQLPGLIVIEAAVDDPAAAAPRLSGSLANAAINDGPIVVPDEAVEVVDDTPAFIPRPIIDGALALRQLRPDITRLVYRPTSGLGFDDPRGWRVYVGQGTDMAQKLAVYDQIVADLLTRGISPTYISVSNQKKPYYGVRPTPEEE